MIFQFINNQTQDVTFTDCESTFDPKLFLYDSDGNAIQSQSTNNCDGDDCYDTSICSIDYRETFTMSNLPVGLYELKLQPYSDGGDYNINITCTEWVSPTGLLPVFDDLYLSSFISVHCDEWLLLIMFGMSTFCQC